MHKINSRNTIHSPKVQSKCGSASKIFVVKTGRRSQLHCVVSPLTLQTAAAEGAGRKSWQEFPAGDGDSIKDPEHVPWFP